MSNILFHGQKEEVNAAHMREALLGVGAADCDVLYIHTDMTFGLPALKRGVLLAELLGILEGLGVATLVFPTFTFSFCNHEPFDVQNTRTPMGALNEYARKTGRGRRSPDPLRPFMSWVMRSISLTIWDHTPSVKILITTDCMDAGRGQVSLFWRGYAGMLHLYALYGSCYRCSISLQ